MRLFLLVLILFQSLSYGDSLQIYPVHVRLSPDKSIATLKIVNKSLQNKFIEVDGRKWTQRKNTDLYKPTNDLLIMPPIFNLLPGEKQVVRVAYTNIIPNKNTDTAYRLVVNELPVHRSKQNINNGLTVRLRLLLPAIYSPSQYESTKYLWKVAKNKKNDARLEIVNTGQKVILVTNWQLFHKKNSITKKHHVLLYVLPNSKRYLSINSPIPNNLIIKSTINGQNKENTI